MPDFKPYLVIGLALGGVYAMSGVGLVVLYRTTGVLNLFYGAVGALGALDLLGADQRARLERVGGIRRHDRHRGPAHAALRVGARATAG